MVDVCAVTRPCVALQPVQPQLPDPLREGWVAGAYGATLGTGEVLVRIKAEAHDGTFVGAAADPSTTCYAADGVGSIFDDPDAVLLRQARESVDVEGVAPEVDRNHRARP